MSDTDLSPAPAGAAGARGAVADRLAAASGAAAVVLAVVGTTLADPAPRPEATITASSDLLAAALADNAGAARAGAWCLLAGAALLIVFVARLRAAVPARPGWAAPAVVVAGAALVAVHLFSARWALAASEAAAYAQDTQVAKVILLVGWNGASLLAPGLAVVLGVGTWACFASDALPRWLGWVGAVLSLCLVTAAALGVAGLSAMPGYLWLALLSVALTFAAPSRRRATGAD